MILLISDSSILDVSLIHIIEESIIIQTATQWAVLHLQHNCCRLVVANACIASKSFLSIVGGRFRSDLWKEMSVLPSTDSYQN